MSSIAANEMESSYSWKSHIIMIWFRMWELIINFQWTDIERSVTSGCFSPYVQIVNSCSYCTQLYASYITYKFSISQLCILTWKTARTITQRPTDLIDNVNKHHPKVQYIDLSAICTRALCISCLFSPCIYQACALTLYLHPTDIKITTLRGISIRNIFYLCSMQERDRPK